MWVRLPPRALPMTAGTGNVTTEDRLISPKILEHHRQTHTRFSCPTFMGNWERDAGSQSRLQSKGPPDE